MVNPYSSHLFVRVQRLILHVLQIPQFIFITACIFLLYELKLFVSHIAKCRRVQYLLV